MAFQFTPEASVDSAASVAESPTVDELCQAVQQNLDLYAANLAQAGHVTPDHGPEQATYTTRTFTAPVDSIAISPTYPEYLIVGTYTLHKADDPDRSHGQTRSGTISVLPISAVFKPSYPGAVAPFLDEERLESAAVDVHFHPNDGTLFGVATSDARMAFYRLNKQANFSGRRIEMRILRLGSVRVADNDVHDVVPMITAFTWLPGMNTKGKAGIDDQHTVAFGVTISDGEVKVLRATIPAIQSPMDVRVSCKHSGFHGEILQSIDMQKHSVEAWFLDCICLDSALPKTGRRKSSSGNMAKSEFLVLSGGDDSAWIASTLSLSPISDDDDNNNNNDNTENKAPLLRSPIKYENLRQAASAPEAQLVWLDRKSHQAGVTAIIRLNPGIMIPFSGSSSSSWSSSSASASIPVLTGSYDDHLRLFLINSATKQRQEITSVNLGGGVWRLLVMDEKTTTTTTTTTTGSSAKHHRYTALILASCMYIGVKILKIIYTTTGGAGADHGWKIKPVMHFYRGHNSICYSSAFRKDGAGGEVGAGVAAAGGSSSSSSSNNSYTIVSTSFYDRKICVWKFVDEDKDEDCEDKEVDEGEGQGGRGGRSSAV